MKLLSFVLVVTGLTVNAAPYITNVVAKQRYPWNGKVDVSYEVVGDVTSEVEAGMVDRGERWDRGG